MVRTTAVAHGKQITFYHSGGADLSDPAQVANLEQAYDPSVTVTFVGDVAQPTTMKATRTGNYYTPTNSKTLETTLNNTGTSTTYSLMANRDGIQYQIELNFGQAATAAPQTVEFTFNIANQGGSERYLRYESPVAQMCSANVPGVYSGSTSTTVWRDSRLTCTLNIEAGVSGSVLLPPVDIEPIPNRDFGTALQPTITVGGKVYDVPPVTMLVAPQADFLLRLATTSANLDGSRPNPMVITVDGQPGMVLMANHSNSWIKFDAQKWAEFKGISQPTTQVLDYTVGAYEIGDDVDAPRDLPEGARIVTTHCR